MAPVLRASSSTASTFFSKSELARGRLSVMDPLGGPPRKPPLGPPWLNATKGMASASAATTGVRSRLKTVIGPRQALRHGPARGAAAEAASGAALAERHERHGQRERGDNWCPSHACASFFIRFIGDRKSVV